VQKTEVIEKDNQVTQNDNITNTKSDKPDTNITDNTNKEDKRGRKRVHVTADYIKSIDLTTQEGC